MSDYERLKADVLAFHAMLKAVIELRNMLKAEEPYSTTIDICWARESLDGILDTAGEAHLPSPLWIKITPATMPKLEPVWSEFVWVTDGKIVLRANWDGDTWTEYEKDAEGGPLPFAPTHYAPIVKPAPPGKK